MRAPMEHLQTLLYKHSIISISIIISSIISSISSIIISIISITISINKYLLISV